MGAEALHQTIFALDVAEFGRLERSNPIRVGLRASLYHLLRQAFEDSGIDWKGCKREDRGDGVLVLADPATAKARFIDPLITRLTAGVKHHNNAASELAQIRLRVALHAGEVLADKHGYVGEDLNFTFRLLDSDPLREALKEAPSGLALIVSDAIYQAVVRQGYGAIDPSQYRPVQVHRKETAAQAWIHVPGRAAQAPGSAARPAPDNHDDPDPDPAARQTPGSGATFAAPRRGGIYVARDVNANGDVVAGDKIVHNDTGVRGVD